MWARACASAAMRRVSDLVLSEEGKGTLLLDGGCMYDPLHNGSFAHLFTPAALRSDLWSTAAICACPTSEQLSMNL